MNAKVRLSSLAKADFAALAPDARGWILEALERFAETGFGNLLELKGRPGQCRLRVWDWCAILRLEDDGSTITLARVVYRRQL